MKRAVGRAAFALLSRLARGSWTSRLLTAMEPRLLARMMGATRTAGPEGRALGFLFQTHEPDRPAREIYADVFSERRFQLGYYSQMGQDLFLNRWFFKGRKPGFFVDVGAFDGRIGSNTWFFEKQLGWSGVAFEPNAPAFEELRRNRSCQVIHGCAYERDGEVSFLALSGQHEARAAALRPVSLTSMALDPSHGAVMLSGIHEHIDDMGRVEQMREIWKLDQQLVTVACHRIDTVLRAAGVDTVDYLSIDVEGAEYHVLCGIDFSQVQVNVIGVERSAAFADVYRLLTEAGFDYHGLLFFDEIFVNRNVRYTWDTAPRPTASPRG